MASKPVRLPFEKKIEIWKALARGEALTKLPTWLNVTEYQCRKLKKELLSMSFQQLAQLDEYPEIQAMHPQYEEFLKWKAIRERTREFDGIFKEWLCSCLSNPHIEICTEHDWKPLHIEGLDYRLDPITWFRLCTPDMSKEHYWRGKFQLLKEYMEAIGFWNHYEMLRVNIWKLQGDYEKVAEKLMQKDKEFRQVWKNIQNRRLSTFGPSRIPADPRPNLEDYKPRYDSTYCDKVMEVFTKSIDGLFDQLCNLESQLQQLNDDLLCLSQKQE